MFRPLEGAIPNRRQNGQLRRQGAQRYFKPHLIVTRSGAAVRHHLGAEFASVFSNDLRLHDTLSANAQRIQLATPHVAHDQITQHLIKISGLGFDQNLLLCAVGQRALLQHLGGFRINAAGIHGDRDYRATIVFLQPRHQEGGVQTSGKRQQNGLII